MIDKLRHKILNFIDSEKDVPLLAGFSVGFYMMLFYYSKNISLANSLEQLLFFLGYYIALPITAMFVAFKLFSISRLKPYRKNLLFVCIIGFFSFYILQLSYVDFSKRIVFAVILVAAALLSIKFGRYYKLLVLLLFFMAAFNSKPVASYVYYSLRSNDEWRKQPDDITAIKFRHKPNVYYIQPDGYTSFNNLKEKIYNFDNSSYESFLSSHGFTLYNNFRSNYGTTLLSNTSMFQMLHHYLPKDVVLYNTRKYIIGDNPVLHIFKNNGYKTSFITEKPYLLVNRPDMGYDYCNINYSELPSIKDGLNIEKDAFANLKEQMENDAGGNNFYFIEKFCPGHINSARTSKGVAGERILYLEKLTEANQWLREVITYIEAKDPEAMIIIAADHGGFIGLPHAEEASVRLNDDNLVYSMFGAQLSIRWGNPEFQQYDNGLKSSVNLFRTVFSFLAGDKKYLQHLQDNSSYSHLEKPKGVYKYIDNKGSVVFKALKPQ